MVDLNYPLDFILCYRFEFYKVVDGGCCSDCAFFGRCPECPKDVIGECRGPLRSDGRDIIFEQVKRPESAVFRAARVEYANYCCEYCKKPISGMNEQWHHTLDADGKRRDKYECFETTRGVCYACHEKGSVLQFFRKEVDIWLLKQYSEDEVRKITGRGLHI